LLTGEKGRSVTVSGSTSLPTPVPPWPEPSEISQTSWVAGHSAPHPPDRRVSNLSRSQIVWAGALAGLVGGSASTLYLGALALTERVLWPGRSSALSHSLFLVMTGIAIAILLKVLGDPGDTGAMVDDVHTLGGPHHLRKLVSLIPVSLLTIAAGAGIGPEPPLMQTTGTVSSWLGRRLGASQPGLRVLTVTGMAAGLTVLFAAPLGAAVFALELLHRKGLEYYEALVPACAGSLASYAVYTVITGRDLTPVWHFPASPPDLRPTDLVLGAAAGIGGAAVAHVFDNMIRALTWLGRRLPGWLRPPAAGAALALLGLLIPTSLTYGETQLGALATTAAITAPLLVLTAVGHLLSAAIPLAGRWRGGIIIPMFLVGYCLGRAAMAANGHGTGPLTFAVCMMVACNVGMTKTPLGSTLVVAQSTGVIQLPAMLLAALVCLPLTTRVTFIGNQRHREDSARWPAQQL
jgi:H+/Cl- antiporter ClcA